jgi:hypothetical protein
MLTLPPLGGIVLKPAALPEGQAAAAGERDGD